VTLQRALLTIGARNGDSAARAKLIADALGGSTDALVALGPVATLPEAVVTAHIDHLAEVAAGIVADAQRGTNSEIAEYNMYNLVLLNARHPERARWRPVLDVLTEESVGAATKGSALRCAADFADEIPGDVRAELGAITERIADAGDDVLDERGIPRRGRVRGLTPGQRRAAHGRSSTCDAPGRRRWRAPLRGDDRGPFWGRRSPRHPARATRRPSPRVRATVAAGLARLAANNDHPLVTAALDQAVNDPGVRVPLAVAQALDDEAGPVADDLRARLRDHRSAAVRRTAVAAR
jgi:hypothetical protein